MQGELSDAELETYSRQIALDDIGYEGQVRIRSARVCLVGAGGLGSLIALQLVAMGVGHLRIVDRDIVCRSDLHRQYLYDVDLLGVPKVEAAFRKLSRLNPDVSIEPVPQSLLPAAANDLIKGADLVLDGLDRPGPRYVLNRACQQLGVPYVFGGAIGNAGNVSTILPSETACIECFMPALKDEEAPRCADVGVHPSVLGMISSVEVSEAIRLITGRGPLLLDKLLHVDLKTLRFVTVNLSRNDACPGCGPLRGASPFPGGDSRFEETCSRDGGRSFILTPKEALALDLDALTDKLVSAGFRLEARGRLGVTFHVPELGAVSVLKSGILILQLRPRRTRLSSAEVRQRLRSVLHENLGLPEDLFPDAN